MRIRLLLALVVAAQAAGCANYRAVGEFAGETTKMTAVVDREFVVLNTLCVEQSTTQLDLAGDAGDSLLRDCATLERDQKAFAKVTVDVLDDYAGALLSLVDDKPFDLSPQLQSVGTKVADLETRNGAALVSADRASAVTRVAAVLAYQIEKLARDDAIKQLIAVTPDVRRMGETLRAFFVPAPGTTQTPPYANYVGLMADRNTSAQRFVANPRMRQAEPIRTTELMRSLKARRVVIDKRDVRTGGAVPTSVAAAIDAWLAALDRFQADGLKPGAADLRDRLKSLRDAVRAAKIATTD